MKRITNNIWRLLTCFAFIAALSVADIARAEGAKSNAGTLGIAAIVNDEAITFMDLQKRAILVMGTSGIKDNAETRRKLLPQVLRALIEEKLKLQEAKKNNIDVSKEQLAKALVYVEKQNKLPEGGLKKKVEGLGLGLDALEAQLLPEIAWMELVNKKLSRNVNVSPEEVGEIVAKLEANKDKPKRLVSEIFLPVENPANDARIKDMADNIINQLKSGASFPALARQFSQSPTAARGGDLEWVFSGQLDEELETALEQLSVGDVSLPIRAIDGYHILLLRATHGGGDKGSKAASGDKYFLSRIVLPSDAAKKASVLKKVKQANSCAVFNEIAEKSGAEGSGYIGAVDVRDMSTKIKKTVTGLAIGQPSKAIKLGGDNVIMMVCNKQDSNKMYSIPSKEVIAKRLRAQRMEMHARRYLRDLRREAIIDLRL
jgi:peptidyl-prolyl cis-trans isomerase SurA